VSKELNHLATILHVCARGLIFMLGKKSFISKREGKYFYTFNQKSSKRAKKHKSITMTPNLPE
jgi:hypothetical protein